MDISIFFFLFAVLAVALIVFGFYNKAKRAGEAETLAVAMGLQYENGDPLDVLRLPHRLFDRGDRRRIDTTVFGSLDGHEVALCDYTYTEVRHNAQGHQHSSDYPMSIVLVSLDGPLPSIQVYPEGVGRKLLNAVGLGNDVQFESEEFNKAFTVLSPDRDFAFTLIDQPMMEWLGEQARSITIEVADRQLLFAVPRIDWNQMPDLASRAIEFRRRFSPLVWELYGGPR